MKNLALVLTLSFFSLNTFAEVPEVVANDMTCVELKASLKNYGSLIIAKKILLFKKRILVYQEANCSSDESKYEAYFKTSTARNCQVGEYCVTDPVYSDYSDYSDSGSSSSSGNDSWSGGSSYGGGSSSSGSSGSFHLALAHAGQATILPVLGPEGLVTVQVVNPNALFGGH